MPGLKSIYVTFLLLLFLPCVVPAQDLNYEEIFAEDWRKAEAFERENKHWIEPLLNENHLSYELVMAVLFPELIRYSALRDKMETTLLKGLYVNLGDEYADFSVGQFQVKPSFASVIRTESHEFLGKDQATLFRLPEQYDDITNYRKSIVVDLEDPRTEFNYIIAFFKICEKKFSTGRMNDEEKIRFFSAAYNTGIDKSEEQIRSMISKKFFSTKIIKSETYCYSDISLFRYRKEKGRGSRLI